MGKIAAYIFSLFCVFISVCSITDHTQYSDRVFFTSILIQIFSVFSIFSRVEEAYSLNKIFYLFSLFFFGIAPLLQFYNNTRMWYYRSLNESEYFYTNIIVIFVLVFYALFYNTLRKIKMNKSYKSFYSTQQHINLKKTIVLFVIATTSFLLVFQENNYSILPMLIRGGDAIVEVFKNQEINESPTKWLIINNFARPMAMMSFLYYAISNNKQKRYTIGLLLIALITCCPTAMPRFSAAAMYIPFILLLFANMRKPYVFSLTFVLGLLVLFPFLNLFRNLSDTTSIVLELNFDMFLEPHFDSYQNFALVVSNELITYGQQLFGVTLFFIPRTVWPDKPIGSGAFTGEILNFPFTNVALNYFGEGYINFGFFGIIIFLIILAYITAKLDSLYWDNVNNQYGKDFQVIYTTLLGLLFFLLRGDLMSSFAYTIGFISSAKMVKYLIYK